MVIKKFFNLINLAKAQIVYSYKLTKIIIVYKNKNLIFANFLVMLPFFKYFNDS